MDEEGADVPVRQMVHVVNPGWTVREATPAARGFSSVYRVVVETVASNRDVFLKAPPDGNAWGISAEARILAVLREHTSIPVPAVIGVVDDHPTVPSPFVLTASMTGDDVAYEEVGWIPDGDLRTVARQVGAYLGELHQVDAIHSFEHVGYDTSRRLTGGRPAGTVEELTVVDGVDSWPAFLRDWIDRELERHASSRFAALTPRLESWCRERVATLTGSFSPVLSRNDHGFHNLLVDPDTGEITAILDWAYTLGVTPAFDFQFGEYLFSGAFLSAAPDVPDRRELVRDAMLAGYRSTAPERYDAVSTHRPLYELLAMVRIMNDFELLAPRLPEGIEATVESGLRDDVETMLERFDG